MVRERLIIESGGDPPPWQLPPLGWVAGRYTDAEDGIDPDLCPVDDDMACAVDSHLRPTRPQMVSINPNALLHNRKHRITGKRRPPPMPQKATVFRHAIWNQVPRRALASWCRLLGRKGFPKTKAKAKAEASG